MDITNKHTTDIDLLIRYIAILQKRGRSDLASSLSTRLKSEIEKNKMENDNNRKEGLKVRLAPMFTPKKIKEHLDKFVIGQDKAKKVLAVAGYKQMLRYDSAFLKEEDAPSKNNVILIGPTGVGKTYLIKVLSDFLDLPFGTADMSRITQSGYVGQDIKTITSSVENNLKPGTTALKKRHSIILLDEIDKVATKASTSGDNVGTTPVQYELLKLIEGVPAECVGNTESVLFIGAGSFNGEISEGKTVESKTVGFGGGTTSTQVPINDQLVDYGLIPELTARFQSGSTLDNLSKKDLINIMKHSKDSILNDFITMFAKEGIKLKFTKGALEEIAEVAIKKGTGARSLNSVLEQVLADIQFERLGSSDKADININKNFVNERTIL